MFRRSAYTVGMAMSDEEALAAARTMLGKIGAHASWAKTKDRTARTANARAAMDAKFLAEADGDPVRAEHLRKAYYQRLALKSAQARRSRAERGGE